MPGPASQDTEQLDHTDHAPTQFRDVVVVVVVVVSKVVVVVLIVVRGNSVVVVMVVVISFVVSTRDPVVVSCGHVPSCAEH